ncbi:MAG: Rho-binding antiterminator [Salibacteraceae bacterium]
MYTPINCNLYDQLEAYAVLKTPLTLDVELDGVSEILEGCLITDFKTQKEGEFAFVRQNEKQMKIRLDKIVSINNIKVIDEFGVSCSIPNKK